MKIFQWNSCLKGLGTDFSLILFTALIIPVLFQANCRIAAAQDKSEIHIVNESPTAMPLDELLISCARKGIVSVMDGKGREYFRSASEGLVRFRAGGYPGYKQ
jgi:hypothetical protein